MMLSTLLAPDTPEWLLITVIIVFLISLFASMGWGLVLEYRYTSPYSLVRASNREKWRNAAILAILQTVVIPIIGFIAPAASPLPEQWLFIPICAGIWVVLVPIVTIFKRWDFERNIKRYQRLDKMIKDKNSIYQQLISNPLMRWTSFFMTAEHKRFFKEGFSEDQPENKNTES